MFFSAYSSQVNTHSVRQNPLSRCESRFHFYGHASSGSRGVGNCNYTAMCKIIAKLITKMYFPYQTELFHSFYIVFRVSAQVWFPHSMTFPGFPGLILKKSPVYILKKYNQDSF